MASSRGQRPDPFPERTVIATETPVLTVAGTAIEDGVLRVAVAPVYSAK